MILSFALYLVVYYTLFKNLQKCSSVRVKESWAHIHEACKRDISTQGEFAFNIKIQLVI